MAVARVCKLRQIMLGGGGHRPVWEDNVRMYSCEMVCQYSRWIKLA